MLLVVHNYYLFVLLLIHSLRTSICVIKYLYMLSATSHDRGCGANNPDFSVDLTRSTSTFRTPEILYIIRRNCYTSQGDPDSSFPYLFACSCHCSDITANHRLTATVMSLQCYVHNTQALLDKPPCPNSGLY